MFSQGHQQGHANRMNVASGGQRMPMLYSFPQQPGSHQPHQAHSQHHQSMPSDHGQHPSGGGLVGHHPTYSGDGGIASANPFASNSLQNGAHAASSRNAQSQSVTPHWAEQLRLSQEAERAHAIMTDQHNPHYYARSKATENKAFPAPADVAAGTNGAEVDEDERRRPWSLTKASQNQKWANMDMSGQGLRMLASGLFRYMFIRDLYIASNHIAYLPASIGQLRHLRLLDASYNQLQEVPPELGMCTYLESVHLFKNMIRTLPSELGSLHLLEMLGIDGNPISSDIKQHIMNKGTKSFITSLREQAPVPPKPSPRKQVIVQADVPASLERLRVYSWNTLCDKFATPAQYGYTPQKALAWEYRSEVILEDIRTHGADIICLQEIATDRFKDFFSPELAMAGYKGVYWPKGRSKTMHASESGTVDGCATFYNATKYILLDKQLIEFSAISINRPDMKNQPDIFNRVMPKDNIAVVCFFESRYTGARFIVVNAHLCWEATLADVKLIQTAILLDHVAKTSEKYARWPACKDKKLTSLMLSKPDGVEDDPAAEPPPEPAPSQEYRSNTEIPLLVCGDFNSTSDSSVYELLSQGRVPPDHPELAGYQYGFFTRDGIEHPFALRSAYAPLAGSPDELPFTNYTPSFAEVIDYLFYSTNTLDVVELLGPPDPEHLRRVPGFPHYHFPADHIQIMADFVIKARKDKKGPGGGAATHASGTSTPSGSSGRGIAAED